MVETTGTTYPLSIIIILLKSSIFLQRIKLLYINIQLKEK